MTQTDDNLTPTPESTTQAVDTVTTSVTTANATETSAEDPVRTQNFEKAFTILDTLKGHLQKTIIGQEKVIEQIMVALLCSNHALVEGVPGLGKTLLAKTLAGLIQSEFNRIQFTPDLMPSDVTGHMIYDMQKGEFTAVRGPVFCNILLADEINRAPAKTQASLLEVMQERQVTLDGSAYKLEPPFIVLATQNPLEHEGTYALPDAQLDRFLLKIMMEYPDAEDEVRLTSLATDGTISAELHVKDLQPICTIKTIASIQSLTKQVTVDQSIVEYATRIVRATRAWTGIETGAGPRGSIALIRAARAQALLDGVDFVTPDTIKSIALPCLRHRIRLTPDFEIEGIKPDSVLEDILEQTPSPRK